MLIPTSLIFPNIPGKIPKTDNDVTIQNLYYIFAKEPWYEELYQDISPNKRTSYTIKCKYPICPDCQPSLFEGYQLKFTWDGREQLSLDEAVEKFRKKFRKEQWFHDVKSLDNNWIEVTISRWLNPNHRFDYYENWPVQYGLLPKTPEEELKNVIP